MLSATLKGIDGHVVVVGSMVKPGLPVFNINGLADASMRETKVRVGASLPENARGQTVLVDVVTPRGKVDTSGLDLPIFLAVVADNDNVGAIGELSLSGEVRPVRGVLAMCEALKAHGCSTVLVSPENATEAKLVDGLRIVSVRTASEAVDAMALAVRPSMATVTPDHPPLDLKDVIGNDDAVRELEAAVAAGENVLILGPPGAGKTMLARRVTGIMPDMTYTEAMEVTRVHSAAGLNIGGGLIRNRPFRAPHHSTTPAGLVGGGTANPRPGEAALAHNGVLMLDEVAEFQRNAIEYMREVTATGEIVLARASGTVRFPAKCMIIATSSECPCGRLGSDSKVKCHCDPETVKRYQARIDEAKRNLNIKRVIRVRAPSTVDLDTGRSGEASTTIKARVTAARSAVVK